MKKKLFTALAVFFCGILYSQTTGTFVQNPLSANRLELSVSLDGTLDGLDSIRIHLSTAVLTDTLLLAEYYYSLSENDPSGFSSFKQTENQLLLGLGLFDAGSYYCRIYAKREGVWEEINLN